MGNSVGKNGDAYENLSGRVAMDLTEREAASAWYRYGVDVTDVYEVIEVLGRGHMGEVFTVRRKTSGHHNDVTRERSSSSSSGGGEDDSKSCSQGKKDARARAIVGNTPKKKNTSTSDGTETSPTGSGRRRKTIKGLMHKTRKVITKRTVKAGGGQLGDQ